MVESLLCTNNFAAPAIPQPTPGTCAKGILTLVGLETRLNCSFVPHIPTTGVVQAVEVDAAITRDAAEGIQRGLKPFPLCFAHSISNTN